MGHKAATADAPQANSSADLLGSVRELPTPTPGRSTGVLTLGGMPRSGPHECLSSPASARRGETGPATDLPYWLEEFVFTVRRGGEGGAAVKEVLRNEGKLRELASHVFDTFDFCRTRVLGFETLYRCVSFLNVTLGIGACSRHDVVRFAQRLDTGGDEQLSAQEFEDLYRHLLLAKLNEYEPATFYRDMFIRRRRGHIQEHYNLLKELGRGTCGLVQKIECKKTRTQRVVKVVDKQHAIDSGLPLKVVMEEIDKLKTLDHPALLRLFEYFVDDQSLYLVTDLLSGGVLLDVIVESHLKGQPLAELWIRKVFLEMCEGISYAHAKGVMHKDLKLDNIMLCSVEPPKAVVIDVGFAELFPPGDADSFHSSVTSGTLSIMAPEVIKGSFTYKCDVWSLGCCLYGLLCRRPDAFKKPNGSMEVHPYPFRPPGGRSQAEMQAFLKQQSEGPSLSLVRGGHEVRDLLRSMLTFEDRQRPRMRQVLAHAWFREARDQQRRLLNPKQLDCLINFHRSNAMEQAVLLDVASQLPIENLQEMAQIFAAIDKDGKGMLNAEDLAVAMEQAGLDPDVREQAVERLTKEGPVEFSRFVAALMQGRRRSLITNHLRSAFERLDTDGDGFLSQDDVRELLRESYEKRASEMAEHMFRAVSPSGPRVSVDTFVNVLGSGRF